MKNILSLTILMILFSCYQNKEFEDAVNGLYEPKETIKLTDKQDKFLWREDLYDVKVQDTVNSIVLNQTLINKISEPEKAVLAYTATFIGNECDWEGEANSDMTNLKCKIISSLNLGYQCSVQHKNYIKKWFGNDLKINKELEECPLRPYTASSQTTFDEINLTTKGNQITINFKASGVNMQTGDSWNWSEKNHFEFKEGKVILVKKEETKPIYEKFDNGDE